ncbi:MAG: DUF7288 family protein [Halanaeroarchaeum sp.]
MTGDDRGQAHSLEAITAGMLLLASILFALQVTAVTPLTGSTSSQHIENQQGRLAEGVLASEADNDTVVPSLLYWNESGKFHGADADGYHSGGPPTAFGNVLNETLRDRNIAFDVSIYYVRENGERERKPMVDLGSPSDHASTATRSFTLYDDSRIRYENGSAGPTLENASYFAPDVSDSRVYNVVEVEVVVWRM